MRFSTCTGAGGTAPRVCAAEHRPGLAPLSPGRGGTPAYVRRASQIVRNGNCCSRSLSPCWKPLHRCFNRGRDVSCNTIALLSPRHRRGLRQGHEARVAHAAGLAKAVGRSESEIRDQTRLARCPHPLLSVDYPDTFSVDDA